MKNIKKIIVTMLIAIMVISSTSTVFAAAKSYTYKDGTYTGKSAGDFEYQLETVVSDGKIKSASMHMFMNGTSLDAYVDKKPELKAQYDEFAGFCKEMVEKNDGSAVDTDNKFFKEAVLDFEKQAGKKEVSSAASSDKVKNYTPTITAYKAGTTTISGACLKNTVVYVKVGSKTYTDKTTSSGKYSVKVPALKKGTKISVSLKVDNVQSKTKTVTVK
ncbi:MAG: hypothetical protein K0S04_198 [Herbinix sp.]|jgi:hypothetical protein|nr:hypothetical protein [Herbinix sp.]